MARAFRVAASGVPGPVHLTLPYDVLHQDSRRGRRHACPSPADFERLAHGRHDHQIARIVELLDEANAAAHAGRAVGHARPGRTAAGRVVRPDRPAVPADRQPGRPGRAVAARPRPRAAELRSGHPARAPGLRRQLRRRAHDRAGVPARPGRARRRPRSARTAASTSASSRDPDEVLAQLSTAARERTWPGAGWRDELDAMRRRQQDRTRRSKRPTRRRSTRCEYGGGAGLSAVRVIASRSTAATSSAGLAGRSAAARMSC